jgi:23S rRNA maturation-related 3'-5' exoribonuclease YhaM
VKECVKEQPHTPDELKEEISSAVIRINAANLRRVVDNFQHKLQRS